MMPSKGWLVVDIETDGDPWSGSLLCIGVADPLDSDVFATCLPTVPDWLRDALADPDVGIVEHTLYDARWLRLHGYEVNGPIADTRVMAWNVNENTPRDLEHLAFLYCDHRMDKRIKSVGGVIKFRQDDDEYVPIGEAPWDQMSRYNIGDVRATAQLFNTLLPKQPAGWERQIDLTSVLLDMETAGVPIDEKELHSLHTTYAKKRWKLAIELTKNLPPAFNLGSDDQVAALLYLPSFKLPSRSSKDDPLPEGFEVEKEGRLYRRGHYVVKGFALEPKQWTESGKRPKVDAKTLAVHYSEHPWISKYLEYQKLDKVIGTYLEAMPRYTHNGRLYGTFNQAGTVTGRLSSSDPNLQNIPRRGEAGDRIRGLFKGNLIVADFSQLEPRLMAHFSEDPALIEVYTQGLDIYKQLASYVFDVDYDDVEPKHREICKTLILGMGYGAKSRTIAEQLALAGFPTTQKTAIMYLGRMEDTYPRFFEWKEEVIDQAHVAGYVETVGGRRRNLRFETDTWRTERQAVNSIIQGSAADIVNETMVLTSRLKDVRILVQVHDELVCEYDWASLRTMQEMLAEIHYIGEEGHGYKLRVPLVFEPKVCETWGDK